VVLLAHQFLLFLVPHGLDLTQQLRLPLIHHFSQFLAGGMNLLLNLLGLRVHLSNHLVNSGDGLGKVAVMTLHLVDVDFDFKLGRKKKREKRLKGKRTLFTKVEMVSLNP